MAITALMEWKTSDKPVPYEEALTFMEARVAQIQAGEAGELVWLLEHPSLFTAGSSAQDSDLIDTLGFPVYQTGRGGQYTYHGPGQRIAYLMLDLKKRIPDVRLFVHHLEQWIINTLAAFDVIGERREGRIGIWVKSPATSSVILRDAQASAQDLPLDSAQLLGSSQNDNLFIEAKIAALGIRIQKWVTCHGIAINVNPDLSHYRGIIPCGISEYGVTSLEALGVNATLQQLDKELIKTFGDIF